MRQQSRLSEKRFINIIYDVVDIDVLLITEIRNEIFVAVLSHLMLDSRLLEIYVQTSKQTRQICRECDSNNDNNNNNKNSNNSRSNLTILNYRFSFIFDNNTIENKTTKRFVEYCLLFFFYENLQRLINIIRSIFDFLRSNVEFCYVLDIFQQSNKLTLYTFLLQIYFIDN